MIGQRLQLMHKWLERLGQIITSFVRWWRGRRRRPAPFSSTAPHLTVLAIVAPTAADTSTFEQVSTAMLALLAILGRTLARLEVHAKRSAISQLGNNLGGLNCCRWTWARLRRRSLWSRRTLNNSRLTAEDPQSLTLQHHRLDDLANAQGCIRSKPVGPLGPLLRIQLDDGLHPGSQRRLARRLLSPHLVLLQKVPWQQNIVRAVNPQSLWGSRRTLPITRTDNRQGHEVDPSSAGSKHSCPYHLHDHDHRCHPGPKGPQPPSSSWPASSSGTSPKILNLQGSLVELLPNLGHQAVRRPLTRSETEMVPLEKGLLHLINPGRRQDKLLVICLLRLLHLPGLTGLGLSNTGRPSMANTRQLKARLIQIWDALNESFLNLRLRLHKETEVGQRLQLQGHELVDNLSRKLVLVGKLLEDGSHWVRWSSRRRHDHKARKTQTGWKLEHLNC